MSFRVFLEYRPSRPFNLDQAYNRLNKLTIKSKNARKFYFIFLKIC